MPVQIASKGSEIVTTSPTAVESSARLSENRIGAEFDRDGMIRHLVNIGPTLGIPNAGQLDRSLKSPLTLDLTGKSSLSHTHGMLSPVADASREAAIKKLSPEELENLNAERKRFEYYNTTNNMIYITEEDRLPGPTMVKVAAEAKRIEETARADEFAKLSAEERTRLRNERLDAELQGKDPNSEPLAREFEQRVLARINGSQQESRSPLSDERSETTSQTSAYDKLLQHLKEIMEPGHQRAKEASELITKSENLNEALKVTLGAKLSGEDLVKELSKFAENLETFANKTNNRAILEVVSMIRQLEALGGDLLQPEARAVAAKLSGLLSTVDTEIKFALRESNSAIIKLVIKEEMNFIGKEAWTNAMESSLERTRQPLELPGEMPRPVEVREPSPRSTPGRHYGDSPQRREVQRLLEEMNLVN